MKRELKILFDTFEAHGFSLYIVGGAVRDSLLKREIKDIDLTTDALPTDIKRMFEKTNAIGERYGTIQVVIGNETFEITTFRRENSYRDGRHPDEVQYTGSLREDLSRRDFTINALAVDENGALIDCFSGLDDLKRKRLQTIGTARDRFSEDGLRKWRALRIAIDYGLEIEPSTFEAIQTDPDTSNISVERIREEFNRIILSDNVERAEPIIIASRLLEKLIERILGKNRPEFCFKALSKLPKDLILRLTALTRDFSLDELQTFLNGLKYDKKLIKRVLSYHQNLGLTIESGIISYKHFGEEVGTEGLKKLLTLQEALGIDQEIFIKTKSALERIIEKKEALTRAQLAIDGKDLIALGYSGKEIGRLLERALEYVYLYPEKNTKNDIFLKIKE